MSVVLSPVGGVAAQFFTNSGAVLTGGKIYTYAAGTSTPEPTYTTASGTIAWTNPIVLDAAGRVPDGGEIWLTDGVAYKFVLKTSNDVLIATYDNISGINSNFVNFTNDQEIQVATAGQTVFTLTTMAYLPGTHSLSVFVDGVNQYGPGASYAYEETNSTTVTFTSGLHVGAEVKFSTTQLQGAGAVDASQVAYDPPFTGSVATNVEAKLAQTVSVKDFGAVGDGVTDDMAAIQNAIDALVGGGELYFPAGTYNVFSGISVSSSNLKIYGDGSASIITSSTSAKVVNLASVSDVVFEDLFFKTDLNNASENIYGVVWSQDEALSNIKFNRCLFSSPSAGINGVKIINESANISDGIYFNECVFKDIGRMGIEFQNHNTSPYTTRYKNVNVQNCKFENLGITIYGFGVSLSGQGEIADISHNVFDTVELGIEIVGTSGAVLGYNKFSNMGAPISMTSGGLVMYRNRVVGNICETASTAAINVYYNENLTLADNYWNSGTNYFIFRGCSHVRVTNDKFIGSGNYSVFIEGTSQDNQFVNCTFDNSAAASNYSTFRCYLSGVTDTVLMACYLLKGTGGVLYDGYSGAETPKTYYCKTGAGGSLFTDVVRSGYKYSIGLLTSPTSAGDYDSALTIDFGNYPSWAPAIINLTCATVNTSGAGSGVAQNTIYVKHQGTTNCSVIANDVLGTPGNLTISTSTSNNTLTITATNGTTSGTNLEFIWNLDVTSINVPVITAT